MSLSAPDAFVHDALYYDSDEELRAAAVPFLRAGLDAGETVAVASAEPVRRLLTAALGEDPRVHQFPHGEVYRRPTSAVAAQREFVERELEAGAPRVRLLGQIRFGDDAPAWRKWAEFESVINVGLAEYPVSIRCLYDTRRLSKEVLAAGELTHPYLIRRRTRRASPRFLDSRDYLRRNPPTDGDSVQATPPVLEMDTFDDLRRLRCAVFDAVAPTPDQIQEAQDFTVAVNEVATNARRHGRPPVRLRLWTSTAEWVCVVTDGGSGVQDPMAGYLPAHGRGLSQSGMGLWLARQLCDDVHLTPMPGGFTVRLTTRH